jgi:hypothetical protein
MKKRVFFLLLAALMMPLAMNAQHNASVHIDTTINACTSYTWPVNGTTYTVSGVHTAIIGDTLYILDININPVYNTIISTPIQGGCTFTWGDSVYTTSGEHTQTFQSAAGCDSTVTITLSLATSATQSYTVTACESYIWKGDTLTASGVNIVHDTSNSLCDSILTLNLTIIEPEQKSYDSTISACESTRFRWSPQSGWINVNQDGYTINSDTYSQSTAATRNIFHPRTVERCFDSTVTIHFNIKNKTYTTFNEKACDVFTTTIYGNEYTYYYSKNDTITGVKGVNGCDSVIYMNVIINKTPDVYISGDLRVAPGSSATLYANSDQNVNYTWSNGSTAESITLTNIQGNTEVSLNGKNASTGCENTAYVTILANLAIEDVNDDMLQIYPNPTTAQININSAESLKNVSIFNLMGQQVINAGTANVVDLGSLTNGAYVVRIEMNNGTVATRTVVLSK